MIPLPKKKVDKMTAPLPLVFGPSVLSAQLEKQRRTVDFDTFDIQVQQLLTMFATSQILIAPAYQRQFRWDDVRCSELVESILLGIPIPNIFMATNSDNTWEVVDGLQRLSAIVKFAGDDSLRTKQDLGHALILKDLKKLDKFNGLTFNTLPPHIQQHFRTRPLKVVTLSDKSDSVVRFDLFERLNTGGIALTKQEIRECVFQGPFSEMLEELSMTSDFNTVVRLTSRQKKDGTAAEGVLRFFAFLDKYRDFDHSVTEFLNGYMKSASETFDYEHKKPEFTRTFKALAEAFPTGLMRPGGKHSTPLNLYEGIAVGAALALRKHHELNVQDLQVWLGSPELRRFTTAATNDRTNVRGRIEFCRDRFLGEPYVPAA